MSVTIEKNRSLEDLIENEKRALVRECFSEVWEELRLEDIEPKAIAEIFIDAALKRLIDERGDKEATRLIAHFKELNDVGFLTQTHSLQ